MAQNIALFGANYNNVPAVLLPKQGGGTAKFTDASPATAVESDVAAGKTFVGSDGELKTGSASGGSSYTLIDEFDVQGNTTSTTSESIASKTYSGLFRADKIVYVRVRDKAGKRPGYFYGSDTYFMNYVKASGSTDALTYAGRMCHRYLTSSQWRTYIGQTTNGYGVYGCDINSSGRLRIYQRYHSTYSLTVNGTYHVEVYLLDWPDGISVFDA